MFGLTLTGWVVAMLAARVLRSSFIKGPATPFVMELPPYRMPTLQGSVGKRLLAGAILGAAELGAAGLLSNVGKLASFQDITFFLGIFTLLFGGMMLFHTMRVKAGAPTSASNSNAQGAFAAQVAFEEAKAMEKLRDSSKGRELAAAPGAIAFFAAAAVVLAGFGVSLAL